MQDRFLIKAFFYARNTKCSYPGNDDFTSDTKMDLPYSKDNYFFAVQSVNEYGNDAIDDSIGGHEGSTIEEEHDDELLEGLKSEGTNTMDDGADEYEAEEATGDDSDPFRYKEDEITRALESEHLDSQNRSENQGQERARE